jgi:hypothetical protein
MLQGAKEEYLTMHPTSWQTSSVHSVRGCQLVPSVGSRLGIHCANRPLLISFQIAVYRRDCYLRFRIRCSQDMLGTDPRYPFHLPLPRRSHRTCYGNARRQRVRCQHSFHAPFEVEQTSQLPFLSQNEIVHCWLGTTISRTNKSGRYSQ